MTSSSNKKVVIVGTGPSGLMAAEILAEKGFSVAVYDRKPSPGRKFLMAGRGGLNLTHSEPLEDFIGRYGAAAARLSPLIEKFPPAALRAWCEGLGQPTFIGSSGRVFPKSFKASPLLRAWKARLDKLGVRFLFQKEWRGWDEKDNLVFAAPNGQMERVRADAVILALGGASWPRLGADGSWVEILTREKISVAPLRPANCGFTIAWSDVFRDKFAGTPLKPVTVSIAGTSLQGEAMITARGIEGGVIYAISAQLRETVAAHAEAVFTLDLRPGVSCEELARRLDTPKRGKSFSSFMRKEGGLSPVAIGLLREADKAAQDLPPEKLSALVKNLPLRTTSPFPIDRAISTAGGICLSELDDSLMLRKKPGVFAAGEMLDWEAPTGGYLLQASFSTAVCAAQGASDYLS